MAAFGMALRDLFGSALLRIVVLWAFALAVTHGIHLLSLAP